VLAPCPVCGGTCTAPLSRVGDACETSFNCDSTLDAGDGVCGNFDPVAGDGNAQGTCSGGKDSGLPCDIDAYNTTFPAPTGGGAGLSLDCFPQPANNISGPGPRMNMVQTTGSSSLSAGIDCGPEFAPAQCPCGVCTGNTALGCSSNTDCSGVGTCAKESSSDPQPNSCSDGVCTDVGGGAGECLANAPDTYCDGVTRADGEGLVSCSTNSDCTYLSNIFGACTLSTPRRCFLDPIAASGVADPYSPVSVATLCLAGTFSSFFNGSTGYPAPVRITRAAAASSFCASNPAVAYTPGAGGCP
jgi:hypothetical protein